MYLKKEIMDKIEDFISNEFENKEISPEMVASIAELIKVISILPKTN